MRVKSEAHHARAKDYIAALAARGRHQFTSEEARAALGVSADAVKLALNRLSKQKLIASPARGFYIIIPPEYRELGSLPGDQFVPALMKKLGLPYYVGLLSAAQYHGAAHHRPQQLQVMVEKSRRPIICGKVHVAFLARKRIREVPVQPFNTPRGEVLASTPEATALDLVGYAHKAGGLDQVATVLAELAEKIDPEKMAAAAASAPVPWAQRLGYLLEQVDAPAAAASLEAYVAAHAKLITPLVPGIERKGEQNSRWKLYVNAKVEAEL